MNRIEFYWWRLREKFCQRYHICYYFETTVGVKGINGIYKPVAHPISSQSFVLKPSELFLGVDYLKDQYTLLGCNIVDSPHFAFVKAISGKEDLSKTDYIKRFENGTLDVRRGVPKQRDFIEFINKYNSRVNEINQHLIKPISVYKIGGRYFIYDGKHRAALCILMGIPISCQLVCVNLFEGKYELIKNNNEYKKHHDLYSEV